MHVYECVSCVHVHSQREREWGRREKEQGSKREREEKRVELSTDKDIFIQSFTPQSNLQILHSMLAMI